MVIKITKKVQKQESKTIPNYQPLSDIIREQDSRREIENILKDLRNKVLLLDQIECSIEKKKEQVQSIENDINQIILSIDEDRFYFMNIINLCLKDKKDKGIIFNDMINCYKDAMDSLVFSDLSDFKEGVYQSSVDEAMRKMDIIFCSKDSENINLICRMILSNFNRINSTVESFIHLKNKFDEVEKGIITMNDTFNEIKDDIIESARAVSTVSDQLNIFSKSN